MKTANNNNNEIDTTALITWAYATIRYLRILDMSGKNTQLFSVNKHFKGTTTLINKNYVRLTVTQKDLNFSFSDILKLSKTDVAEIHLSKAPEAAQTAVTKYIDSLIEKFNQFKETQSTTINHKEIIEDAPEEELNLDL